MTEVRRAQTWSCNEARADADDVPPAHDTVTLWADHPQFSAVVDRVVDGVAQLTVTMSNDHPRAPDHGEIVDVHVETLQGQARWSCKSDAPSAQAGDEIVTDGGLPHCEVGGCAATVAGLEDGRDVSRGLVCTDCFDYKGRHNHWPDEDVKICIECRIDNGAIRHECDETYHDYVIVGEDDDACRVCGEVVRDD